jgi:DNA polymerase III subunit gamma/tau
VNGSAGGSAAAASAAGSAGPAVGGAGLGLLDVRRAWPDVVERTKSARRLAWSLLSQSAQVHALEGNTLTVAFVNAGSRDSFARNGCDEVLRQVLIDVLGVDWRVESIVDPSATPSSAASPPAAPGAPVPPAAAAAPTGPDASPAPPAHAESGSAAVPAGSPRQPQSVPHQARAVAATEGAHLDDEDVDGGDTHELLTRELGAQVIEEIPHQP